MDVQNCTATKCEYLDGLQRESPSRQVVSDRVYPGKPRLELFQRIRTQCYRVKRILRYQPDPYWTHVPYLCAVSSRVHAGTVCEFGVGDYSTPVIHYLFGQDSIISYDHTAWWLKRFESQFSTERHVFTPVCDWNAVPLPQKISLAFIDHNPESARELIMSRVDGIANVIVLHDAENFGRPKNYKFMRVLGAGEPKTLICSHEDILD